MQAAVPSAPERDILVVGGGVGKWRRQRNPRRFQPFGGTAEARNSMLVMPRICRTPTSILRLALVLAASLGLALANQDSEGSESSQESIAKADPSAQAAGIEVGQGAAGTATEPEQKGADRTELNLLGEVDSDGGESRRNENVQLTLVDNNVQKEINIRMGTSATIVREFDPSQGFFGSEFGNPSKRQIHLKPAARRDFHGSIYETHGNSIFSARSFFQVGSVMPARTNDYGASLLVPLPAQSSLSVDLSQQRKRGNVNGNVLIPLPEERTPLAVDPALRAVVSRILDSFPAEPPNRPDINPRAHNTNAPQTINNDSAGARLDLPAGSRDRASLDYRFRRQAVDAFQLVQGQNPNTTTGSHDGRITWTRDLSAESTSNLSAGFRRMTSLITQDETAFGPLIFMMRQLQTLGGTSSIPYDRAQNFYRYAGSVATVKGNHRITSGFSTVREQLNGIESSGHGGMIMFSSNFGRDMITNVRLGTPSRISQSVGTPHRGFRRWRMQYFAGDTWTVRRDLTLSFGIRYEPTTRPVEVNGLSDLPYRCDCNNLAPTLGFAYRTPLGVLRGAYGLQYGEIFTATYTQERFNPPGNIRVNVVAPDLLDPFAGLSIDAADPNARSTIIRIAPDLVAPYSHQYNFSWEVANTRGMFSQIGYVGSRSHRLLSGWVLNRARQVEGLDRTVRTVNQRRPDQRYYDVRRILNGSRAYFDAAKATLGVRDFNGLTFDVSYWLSKAIDLGAHYASNASTRDAFAGRSQTEFEVHGDVKALSDFDQPHAAIARVNYRTPSIGSSSSAWNKAFGGWELFSVILLKTGTPFIMYTGSDGPGFGNVDGVMGDRPLLLDTSVLGRSISHPDTSRKMLPRSAFGFVPLDVPSGNLGRNVFRKDGIQNVNLSVARSWKIASESTLTLRAESINLLNTPQFAYPGNDLSGGNFGQITNTLNDGRTFSLTMRLSF